MQGLFIFLVSVSFFAAQGCCGRRSLADALDNALICRKHAKILQLLEKKELSILKHPPGDLPCLENVLLYKGLASTDDIIEFGFRKHYEKFVKQYWEYDLARTALKIILACDNERLFDVLMAYDKAKKFIRDTPEGQYIFSKYSRKDGKILKKIHGQSAAGLQLPCPGSPARALQFSDIPLQRS